MFEGCQALEALPLFADERAIGKAILGPARASEWPALAATLEKKGLPVIDPLAGGRYVWAVRAFFDYAYELSPILPVAPDWNSFEASVSTCPADVPAVYFVAAAGFVKIGHSVQWPKRMIELQVGCPFPLQVLHVMGAPREHEAELHRKFEHLRAQGEWFRGAEDLLAFIDDCRGRLQ